MSDEKRDVRAVVRTYEKDGEKKNVYQTVGQAWVSEHGSKISIQIETLPIDKNWDGRLFINKPYEPKDKMPVSTVTDVIYKDVVLEDIDDSKIPLSEIPFK